MKIFLVACLLSISFLSHGWGKHFLVKTADANEDDDADANEDDDADADYSGIIRKDENHDKFGLDTNTVDAETLMYTVLTDRALDIFEKYPEQAREQVFKEIDKLIDYARNGEGVDDYQGLGIISNIKRIFLGGEKILGGGSQMLGGGADIMGAINHFINFIPDFI